MAAKRGQAGGMAVGPPCVPVPPCPSWSLFFCGQHLQPALHAKHTLQRGRLHMGLRGQKKSIPEAVLGGEGGGSPQQPLSTSVSQMKPWGDAVMRDERINSWQIIFRFR